MLGFRRGDLGVHRASEQARGLQSGAGEWQAGVSGFGLQETINEDMSRENWARSDVG